MRRLLITLLAVSPFCAGAVQAASFDQAAPQKAHVALNVNANGCENNPGPYITINGEMRLSGLNARVVLTNNKRFTHVATGDVTADVVLVPYGSSLQINKQPSRGGVGGNPWIYLQFNDTKGKPYGSPVLLGRCVQGLAKTNGTFSIPGNTRGTVTSGDCNHTGGPTVSLNGELRIGGLGATIILTNNAKFTHATAADVQVEIVLIPEGESLVFAKQPPLGGAGGNPLIYLQFLSGANEPLSNMIFLGRCGQF